MNDLQYKLFENIRLHVKDQKHWIDEVADVLSKSKHAIYKKIQGETCLSLDEVVTLASHYRLHLDPLIRPDTVMSFEFPFQDNKQHYTEYLSHIQLQLQMARNLSDVMIWHTGIELPFIHDHLFPDLVAFKFFIHGKTVWSDASSEHTQFDLTTSRLDSGFRRLLRDILDQYYQFPTTEIWNGMILDITLSQIRYALQSRMFVRTEDALELCDALEGFVLHMELMAEHGVKYVTDKDTGAPFILYYNEIAHSINVLLLKSAEGKVLYLGFANPQFMYSHTGPALTNAERWLKMLRSNATPITLESRKERMAFFTMLQKKIGRARRELEAIIVMHGL